uniref:PLA2c domain-containing protein n=1 Tax=Pelodiscus sinensis TaxID=13735 RepID=K7F3X9_PELSI
IQCSFSLKLLQKKTADDTSVRFSSDLSEGEKEATESRKKTVLECLKTLGISCEEKTMPNIAVLGSGGGLRATIALLGTLTEMKNQGLLDAVMYLCGVSGSTWCMSTLYNGKDWAKNIVGLEGNLCAYLHSAEIDIEKELGLVTKAADGELFSLTDVWEAFVVKSILKLQGRSKLSEHKAAASNGINPYPIYAAIEQNTFDKDHTSPGKRAWFEFTPDESGFPGLDVFVSTKDLGSKFQGGNLTAPQEEKDIGYLQSLWGSALGSMQENKHYLIADFLNIFEKKTNCRMSKISQEVSYTRKSQIKTRFFILRFISTSNVNGPSIKLEEMVPRAPPGWQRHQIGFLKLEIQRCYEVQMVESDQQFQNVWGKKSFQQTSPPSLWNWPKTLFPDTCCSSNSTKKKLITCFSNWTWGSTNNFLHKNGKIQTDGLDEREVLNLIDAGVANNCAYPLVLRPARRVGLILSFDFSDGDPFETLKKASQYCVENQILFPPIDVIKDQDNPSDCYVFEGQGTPTVMHFPLFNTKNCPEPQEIEKSREKFGTFNMYYAKNDVDELLSKAGMNVSNNKEKILEQIQKI